MKPIDEGNDFPEDKPDDVDSEETIEEGFDLEVEIKRKRRGRPGRTGKEYGSLMSFLAWMAFVIIWLFFLASGYDLFTNIAVVFVSFLVVGALNAVVWIPSYEGGWRAKASMIGGIVWVIFTVFWLLFFSASYGIFENIAIVLDALLAVGAFNVLLWVPSKGEGIGAKISALGGIGWLMFLIFWAPFYMESYTIYQNVAVFLLSFLIMMIVVMAPWTRRMRAEIHVDLGRRPHVSLFLFMAWVAFIIMWMWFFAGAFTAERNAAIVLLSIAVGFALLLGMWLPWARRRGEGPESWTGIGLGFAWVLSLTAWFWFFAEVFDAYQNFAVFLVSLLIAGGIGAGLQWKKYRDFEAMDWTD